MRFGGRYEAVRVVGRGGEGEVWEAWDHHHERTVALKVRTAGPSEERRAVLAEARTLLSLEPHAGLPLVRDDFFAGDRHVMVMDWVDGTSLAALLLRRGEPGLAPATVLPFLEQTAAALEHLHGHNPGVVHGDVKPANLIVTTRGQVVLVDFGLARRCGAIPAGGTPGYVAPEVAAGERPTTAADVYGLAATAFTLLTGDPPCGVAPSWEGLDPTGVPALERALRRALSLEPSRRPRAAELIERLAAWHRGDLPRGVVTFCACDLLDPASEADSAGFDSTVAELVEDHGGRLLRLRGNGETTLSVFPRATAAAAAAMTIRARTASGPRPLDVRLALHTGEPEVRDGRYHGPALERTAALLGLASPRQILVSSTTAALVADQLPSGARLTDRGERPLHGPARPERVFELGATDDALAPPEPAPLPVAPVASMTGPAPLVGRAPELGELTAALDNARSGHGQLALVAGEPGIGKTRLLEELASLATASGAQVLWGRCHEGEGTPAFWPWVRVLETHIGRCSVAEVRERLGTDAGVLVNLLPGLRERFPDIGAAPALEAGQARFRQFEAVTRFLAAGARTRPVVALIEDLHRADPSTLQLLQFLAHEIGSSGLLVVATYRDVDLTRGHPLIATLAELRRHSSIRTLHLAGVRREHLADLIAHQLGRPPEPPLVDAVWRRTEGNPFFVSEIVRLLRTEGSPDAVDRGASRVPRGVREVIGRRLDQVSSDALKALTAGAVIGRDFAVRVLEPLTGLDLDRLLDALDEAAHHGLVRALPDAVLRYRFEHALIYQTLYDDLSAARRARIHLQIAETLESIEPRQPPAVLAHHLAEASKVRTVPRAVTYAELAGDEALGVLAYESAVDHYRRALEMHDNSTRSEPGAVAWQAQRCELLLKFADALARAGRRAESRSTWTVAAGLARTLGDGGGTLARAVLGLASVGQDFLWAETGAPDHELIAHLEEAATTLTEDTPLRVKVLASLAAELYFVPDSDERRMALSDEAVAIARRLDDPGALIHALGKRHLALWRPDNADERLRLARETLALARTVADPTPLLLAHEMHIPDLLELGDLVAATHHIAELDVLSERLGLPTQRWFAITRRAMLAIARGDVEDARRRSREAFELGTRVRGTDATQIFTGQTVVLDRDVDGLAAHEDAVAAQVTRYPEVCAWRALLALVHLGCGQVERARTGFREMMRRDVPRLPMDPYWPIAMATMADLCCDLDEPDHAVVLHDALLAHRSRLLVGGAAVVLLGVGEHYLGRLAATAGRVDEAVADLEVAVRTHEALGTRALLCRSQLALAVALRARGGSGDAARATDLVGQASATADRLGLRALAVRARALRSAPGPG